MCCLGSHGVDLFPVHLRKTDNRFKDGPPTSPQPPTAIARSPPAAITPPPTAITFSFALTKVGGRIFLRWKCDPDKPILGFQLRDETAMFVYKTKAKCRSSFA